MLEETGWQVTVGPLLPDVIALHPDFVQLVYMAKAVSYRPEAKEQHSDELGTVFGSWAALAVGQSDQLFLQAAVAVIAA